MPTRCAWVPLEKEYYVRYHDEEWGVPLHDDRALFEMLVLEGAQAGLSWDTILRKREGYRRAFAGFDPQAVARFGPEDEARILADPGVVRNRLKIASAVKNARAVLKIQEERGSFDAYLWDFVEGTPVVSGWKRREDVPARTPLSDVLAKDLKGRGMSFVGSTTMYALLQAAGLVNDHTYDCFRYRELI
ncbi:MAG: DNA-3-methyladenine glycosylase I [Desulfovibrionaceae bacterium]